MEQRLIDADALKEALMNRLWDDEARVIEIVEEEIDNAPTVDTTFREVVAYECGQKSVSEVRSPIGHKYEIIRMLRKDTECPYSACAKAYERALEYLRYGGDV